VSGSREKASLWFYLGFWKNWGSTGKRKWRLPEFFQKKLWRNSYFMTDTFWTPLNKLIGCKILGHRHIIFMIDDCDGTEYAFCYSCYQKVNYMRPDDPWQFGKRKTTIQDLFIKDYGAKRS